MRGALAGALLTLATAGGANDGWWAATGAAGGFGKHEHVQMVSEVVHIKLSKLSASVEVDFVFKNHGQATTVTMGFPERYSSNHDRGMENFRSSVDGNEVRVRKKVLDGGEEYDDWSVVWLKEVAFGEGQTRKVRVSYDADYSGNTMGHRSLTYILSTGATWRAPIETCRIVVDLTGWKHGPPDIFFTDRDPARAKMWKRDGSRIEAVLSNVTPDFDLRIEFVPAFWNFTVNGTRVAASAFLDLIGEPQDPLIPMPEFPDLGDFFGAYDDEWRWKLWRHPAVEKFGGEFRLSEGALEFADGRRVQLARKPVRRLFERWEKEIVYVFLRDVVEALGGTYTYVSEVDGVDIIFPGERPPGAYEDSSLAVNIQSGQEQQSRPVLLLALAALVPLAVFVALKLRARAVQST